MQADTICLTDGCPRWGEVISSFIGDMEDENVLFEGYGHGAEDPQDYCPKCGVLAILQDPYLVDEMGVEVVMNAHLQA